MRDSKTRVIVFSAICIALALALDYVKLFTMPQGGSVSACSMFFIVLAGYWFGPVIGCLTGVVVGLIDLMLAGYVVHPIQLLLDYPLAFGMLGFAGFFRKMRFALPIGYVAGAAGRFIMHLLSGYIFFAQYTPEGQHPFIYSAVYNILYMAPEVLITLVIICFPAFGKVVDTVGKRWFK